MAEAEPEFLAPLENHTVTQGRDVFFTCVVNHLENYKVKKKLAEYGSGRFLLTLAHFSCFLRRQDKQRIRCRLTYYMRSELTLVAIWSLNSKHTKNTKKTLLCLRN